MTHATLPKQTISVYLFGDKQFSETQNIFEDGAVFHIPSRAALYGPSHPMQYGHIVWPDVIKNSDGTYSIYDACDDKNDEYDFTRYFSLFIGTELIYSKSSEGVYQHPKYSECEFVIIEPTCD